MGTRIGWAAGLLAAALGAAAPVGAASDRRALLHGRPSEPCPGEGALTTLVEPRPGYARACASAGGLGGPSRPPMFSILTPAARR